MSAIQNYVHYHAANYLRYGADQRRGRPHEEVSDIKITTYWTKARIDLQAKISSYKKKMNLQELQDELNGFLTTVTAKEGDFEEGVRKVIEKEVRERSNLLTEADKIDLIHGRLELTSKGEFGEDAVKRFRNVRKRAGESKKEQKNEKRHYAAAVLNRLKKAFNELGDLINEEALSENEVKTRLIEVTNSLQSLGIVSKEIALSENLEVPQILNELDKIKGQRITYEQAKNAIKAINVARGTMSLNGYGTVVGDITEYSIAAALAYRDVLAEKISDEKMLEAFEKKFQDIVSKGGKKQTSSSLEGEVKVVVNTDVGKLSRKALESLGKEVNNQIFKKFYNDKGDYVDCRLMMKPSQQKLDISMTSTFSSEPLGLSVKSLQFANPRAKIGLVDKSPLITLISKAEGNKLGTHFLNILSAHPDSEINAFKRVREIGKEVFTLQMLYAALSGRDTGKTEGFADILVLRNNNKKSSGIVKLYDIPTLITEITKTNMNDIIITPSRAKTIDKLQLWNEYIPAQTSKARGIAIQTRLTRMIFDAHQEKISVALKKDRFL